MHSLRGKYWKLCAQGDIGEASSGARAVSPGAMVQHTLAASQSALFVSEGAVLDVLVGCDTLHLVSLTSSWWAHVSLGSAN